MVLVTTIADNVVQDSFSFIDNQTAEKVFAELVEYYENERGLSPGEMEDSIDDGYYDCTSGFTVCIHHPETDFNNDFLMSIREGK